MTIDTSTQSVDTPLSITPQQWRELNAQLVELQTQLAFQEDALQALDDVVTRQQQSIDRLMQLQQRLERQLVDQADTAEQAPADQRSALLRRYTKWC
jgi:SlyX protein